MIGVYLSSMHEFLQLELELGLRVASYLDSENNCGWSALDDLIYEKDMSVQGKESHMT